MITIEQKHEVIRLYHESRSKAEISRLAHISRPKVSEIIKEDEENIEQKRENGSTSEIVRNSMKELKSELTDYEKALQRIKNAANNGLLGPSVRKAIADNGFILKESGRGIKEQIAAFLDDLKVKDAIKIIEMLREIVSISNIRKDGQDSLMRYVDFTHYIVRKRYSKKDMNFLIQKGPLLDDFRNYQRAIDLIAAEYNISESEAIFFAFRGISDYYRKIEELERKIKKKRDELMLIEQTL